MISSCQTDVKRSGVGFNCKEPSVMPDLQSQTLGKGATLALRARLWVKDGSARVVWPKKLSGMDDVCEWWLINTSSDLFVNAGLPPRLVLQIKPPLPSIIQHLNYDVHLEAKREDYQNRSVLYCEWQLCPMICLQKWRFFYRYMCSFVFFCVFIA